MLFSFSKYFFIFILLMPVQSKTTLKTYFQTGNIPTQGNFEDLIDSLAHTDDYIAWEKIHVSTSGDDADDGSEANPLATFAEAVTRASASANENIHIHILTGTYREHLDCTVLADKLNVKVTGEDTTEVRIMNSVEISSFTKTPGYTNIYQAAFAGTLSTYLSAPNPQKIFELGILGNPVSLDYPQVRHLLNTTKYVELFVEAFDTDLGTTLTNLDAQPSGGFYLDSGVMYIVSSDQSDLTSNGRTYEASIVGNSCADVLGKNIHVDNISFYFSDTHGLQAVGTESVKTTRCVFASNNGNGAVETAPDIYAFGNVYILNNTAGVSSSYGLPVVAVYDGEHHASGQVVRDYCWSTLNLGAGFGEASQGLNVYRNCLSTYNGNGYQIISVGYTTIENSVAIGNTYNGFHNRQPIPIGKAVMRCFNCVSEANDRGYFAEGYFGNENNTLEVINSFSYNNTTAEISAAYGTVILRNVRADNVDPLKIQPVLTNGVITIENGELVE